MTILPESALVNPIRSERQPVGFFEWAHLIRELRIPGDVKKVALILGLYADCATGARAHPGIDRLARDCDLSRRAVMQHLVALRDAYGLVTATWRPGPRRTGYADVYQLTVPHDIADRVDLANALRLVEAEKRRAKRRAGQSPPPRQAVDNSVQVQLVAPDNCEESGIPPDRSVCVPPSETVDQVQPASDQVQPVSTLGETSCTPSPQVPPPTTCSYNRDHLSYMAELNARERAHEPTVDNPNPTHEDNPTRPGTTNPVDPSILHTLPDLGQPYIERAIAILGRQATATHIVQTATDLYLQETHP